MNYTDIKKYGKTLTIDGQPFIKLFDCLVNNMWSCGLCSSRVTARKSAVAEIEKGIYGHEMYHAMKSIETLKAMDVLE